MHEHIIDFHDFAEVNAGHLLFEEWLQKLLAGPGPNLVSFSSMLHACARTGVTAPGAKISENVLILQSLAGWW